MANGPELQWIFCPYCKEGEGCTVYGDKILCPTTRKFFTVEQSLEAIKNR